MALGFLYGAGGGGGGNEPNPIIVEGNVVNYRHDATLLNGTDSVYFTGGQTPYIYDVDFTDIGSLEIVTKGGYGYGAYLMLTINGQNISKQYSGSAYETMVFDVSAYSGINSIKFSYTSSGNRCDISSMTLAKRPEAKFPVIYDHGSWSIGYDNPGGYTYSSISVFGATLEASDIKFTGSSSSVCTLGTANKIDLTNYTLLKYRHKASLSNMRVEVRSTKAISDAPAKTSGLVPASADYVEYALDVSALTGEYYINLWAATAGGAISYFDKIWLT